MTENEAINEMWHYCRRQYEQDGYKDFSMSVIHGHKMMRVRWGDRTDCKYREKDFYFETLKIPKIGTPVKDLDSGRLGYVESVRGNSQRELWITMIDRQDNVEHSWTTMNWIELQDVKP